MSSNGDNAFELFRRLADITGAKTDAALADQLGVSRQTVANAKSRNTVPFRSFLQFAESSGYSLDYLLLGRGVPKARLGEIDAQLLGQILSTLREVSKNEPVMEEIDSSPFAVSLLYNSVIRRSPNWEALYLNDLNKLINDEVDKILQARKLKE